MADILVTSGGVSVGDYDLVKKMLEELGQMNFWKVAMRPGQPLAFGTISGKPLFGLPGNPVSSMVSFEQFVRPSILKMSGHKNLFRPTLKAILREDIIEESRLGPFHPLLFDSRRRKNVCLHDWRSGLRNPLLDGKGPGSDRPSPGANPGPRRRRSKSHHPRLLALPSRQPCFPFLTRSELRNLFATEVTEATERFRRQNQKEKGYRPKNLF